MRGTNRGLFSKLNSSCKKLKRQSMVSCQEPPPLKGSKHSLQSHPHDAALVNAHSFVSMGVEARCCPCHSTAHCRHMKRHPSLCQCCPCCSCRHCDCHLCLRCRAVAIAVAITIAIAHRHCHHRRPLPSRSPSPIATTISVTLPSAIAIAVALAVDHCHLHHHQPLQLPSPSAIAVAIAVGHCQEFLPWSGENCI
jgi:hypothetical protein